MASSGEVNTATRQNKTQSLNAQTMGDSGCRGGCRPALCINITWANLGETPLILTTMHPRGFCQPAPASEAQVVPVGVQQQPAQQAGDIRQQLEGLLQRSSTMPPDGLPVKLEESKLTRLLDRRNGPVKRRKLLQNWACNCGINAQLLDQMLETLTTAQSVVVSSRRYEVAPDYT